VPREGTEALRGLEAPAEEEIVGLRVLLADDHAMIRDGLKALLEREGGFTIVESVADGHAAIAAARSLSPDLVVMDVSMPRMNGIEAARAIAEAVPAVKILILSMQGGPEQVYRALQAGAHGYLLKDSAGTELIAAVRMIQAGRRYLSQAIDEKAVSDYLSGRDAPLERLSPRERNILQLIVEGHSNTETARILSLSVKTVETYRSRMMQKLEIGDLPALVKFALEHGVTQLK
jgi:DNA-binding NarL/FixJ family response regulator